MTAIYGNLNHAQTVTGTDNAYLAARDWTISSGRTFSEGELSAGSAVCILGSTVTEALFGDGDPLGETIRLKQISCRVIGTLEEKGASGFGSDQDDVILMPIKAVQRRVTGSQDIPMIFVGVADGYDTAGLRNRISRRLFCRRNESDTRSVENMRMMSRLRRLLPRPRAAGYGRCLRFTSSTMMYFV